MKEITIILLGACLLAIVALGIEMLVGGMRCGHGCGRKSAKSDRYLKSLWRKNCLEWRMRAEPRPEKLGDFVAFGRWVEGMPAAHYGMLLRMNEEAVMHARGVTDARPRVRRREWRWLRERGLAKLGAMARWELRQSER